MLAFNPVFAHVVLLFILTLGFTTNGEWNSLRTKGNTRPLSVLQIRSDVRAKYAKLKAKKLIRMLSPKCKFV